jgi:hypothetical protein
MARTELIASRLVGEEQIGELIWQESDTDNGNFVVNIRDSTTHIVVKNNEPFNLTLITQLTVDGLDIDNRHIPIEANVTKVIRVNNSALYFKDHQLLINTDKIVQIAVFI